jgi:hypothetical protein
MCRGKYHHCLDFTKRKYEKAKKETRILPRIAFFITFALRAFGFSDRSERNILIPGSGGHGFFRDGGIPVLTGRPLQFPWADFDHALADTFGILPGALSEPAAKPLVFWLEIVSPFQKNR